MGRWRPTDKSLAPRQPDAHKKTDRMAVLLVAMWQAHGVPLRRVLGPVDPELLTPNQNPTMDGAALQKWRTPPELRTCRSPTHIGFGQGSDLPVQGLPCLENFVGLVNFICQKCLGLQAIGHLGNGFGIVATLARKHEWLDMLPLRIGENVAWIGHPGPSRGLDCINLRGSNFQNSAYITQLPHHPTAP